MVGQQDFEPAEWQLLCQAPTYAGLVVAGAQRGGLFWEALSIARTFSEVRAHHGQSRLLDDICAERPLVEQTRFRSPEQLRRHGLDHIRAAVDLLAQKASPPTSTPTPASWPRSPTTSPAPTRKPTTPCQPQP